MNSNNQHLQNVVHGSPGRALTFATMGFFSGFAGVAVFGPLVPRFTHLMHLSPVAAGLLAAIASLTGSILRIPFGAWVDRSGGKKPFLILLILGLVGLAGLIVLLKFDYPHHLAGTYPLLLVLGMLVGSGIATFSVGIGQVSYWFPKARQGGPLGTFAGIGNLGSGLFSLLLPLAVVAFGMIAAFELWFLFLLCVTITYAIFMKDAPSFQLQHKGQTVTPEILKNYGQDIVPHGSALQSLLDAAHIAPTWALVVLYFTSFGGFLALTAWLPTFWHGQYHTALVTGGALTLVFSVLASLVRVPGGSLADRTSIRYALSVNVLTILLGTLIVIFSATFSVALLGTILIALGMGLQNAVVFKLVPHYVPEAVGGAAGWVGGLGAFGGFVIPPIMGALSGLSTGVHEYGAGFWVFAVLAVIDWVVIGWLKHYDRTMRATSGTAVLQSSPMH